MPEEEMLASPGLDPPTRSAAGTDEVQDSTSKDHQDCPYTPVAIGASLAVTPEGYDLNTVGDLPCKHQEELADLDHRLEVAKRRTKLAQVEQEAAEGKARSWAKIVLLRLSVCTAIAAVLHTVAWGIWEFIHPLSDFELVVSSGTFAVSEAFSCVGLYLTGRFGKGKPSTSAPDSLDEATASLFGEADSANSLSHPG